MIQYQPLADCGSALKDFVQVLEGFFDGELEGEDALIERISVAMVPLLANDDWLDSRYANENEERYCQYLLYGDPADRYSVVSFVWGVGQYTPVHNHLTWGVIGILRGAEKSERFELINGVPQLTDTHVMRQGDIAVVSPSRGDIHRVSNARIDGPSISIHVYGTNIGNVMRHAFADDGTINTFVSGYSTPNQAAKE